MENVMEKITTEMGEHICDHLCHWPREIIEEDALVDICCECKMAAFVCNILNTYNNAK